MPAMQLLHCVRVTRPGLAGCQPSCVLGCPTTSKVCRWQACFPACIPVSDRRLCVCCTATACRFEELAYADAASYMDDGKVVFTGSPSQMVARLKSMGASVRL